MGGAGRGRLSSWPRLRGLDSCGVRRMQMQADEGGGGEEAPDVLVRGSEFQKKVTAGPDRRTGGND